MLRPAERLLLITDRRLAPGGPGALVDLFKRVLGGVPPGVALVQLREKDLGGRDLLALARAMREVTAKAGARLVVNDRVDVALACGADGVHLPENGIGVVSARAQLGPDRLVGVSTHGGVAAAVSAAAGADYVTVGPVWATPSKVEYGAPLGLEGLAVAVAAVAGRCTVLALGGIDGAEQARAARGVGADGVGVIRAVLAASARRTAAWDLVDVLARAETTS